MTTRVPTTSGSFIRIHHPSQCAGEFCCIHNPSDHPLKDVPLYWRSDRKIMERICEHGVGHPDPDDYSYRLRTEGPGVDAVHGCDGCCMFLAAQPAEVHVAPTPSPESPLRTSQRWRIHGLLNTVQADDHLVVGRTNAGRNLMSVVSGPVIGDPSRWPDVGIDFLTGHVEVVRNHQGELIGDIVLLELYREGEMIHRIVSGLPSASPRISTNLSSCEECGNSIDTPGHEWGCLRGRAEYGHDQVTLLDRAQVYRDLARDVPIDLWATYGRVPRTICEGFRDWLLEKADREEQMGRIRKP